MKSKKFLLAAIISGVAVIFAAICVLSYNSTNSRLHRALDLGRKSMDLGDWDQAIASFTKAIEIDPNNLDILEDLSNSYLGRIDKSINEADYTGAMVDINEVVKWLDEAIRLSDNSHKERFIVLKDKLKKYREEADSDYSGDEKDNSDEGNSETASPGDTSEEESGNTDNSDDSIPGINELEVDSLDELEETLDFRFASGPIPYIRSHTIMGEIYAPYIASYEANIAKFENGISSGDAKRILNIYRKLYVMYSESGHMDKAVDVYHKFQTLAAQQSEEIEWRPGWVCDEYGRYVDGYGSHLEYAEIEKPTVISSDGDDINYMEYDNDGRLIHSRDTYTDATFEYDGLTCTETSVMSAEVTTTTITVYSINPSTGEVTRISTETIR